MSKEEKFCAYQSPDGAWCWKAKDIEPCKICGCVDIKLTEFGYNELERVYNGKEEQMPDEYKTAQMAYEVRLAKESSSNIGLPPKKEERKEKVITLCGSTRYKDEFFAVLENLTLAGNIVMLPGYFGHQEGAIPISETVKENLDALHKKKIDMSDIIYVINKDGYIGESTKSEIAYALAHNKEVLYYEDRGEKI